MGYFKGWYFKCCTDDKTIAFIPAYHYSDNKTSASLQIITDDAAYRHLSRGKDKTHRKKHRHGRAGQLYTNGTVAKKERTAAFGSCQWQHV